MDAFVVGFSKRSSRERLIHLACPPHELTHMPSTACICKQNLGSGFHDVFLKMTELNIVSLLLMELITHDDAVKMQSYITEGGK
jgi:hypothetical protein